MHIPHQSITINCPQHLIYNIHKKILFILYYNSTHFQFLGHKYSFLNHRKYASSAVQITVKYDIRYKIVTTSF